MTSQEPPTDDLGMEFPLPDDYCQLSITHPAYPAPLLWVCAKMENLMEVIARWSHPQNLMRLHAMPTQQTRRGRVHLLMYTIPPRTEPNFLSQLYWENFDHIQEQKVQIAFHFLPQALCSECRGVGWFGEILPKPECEICYERPAYHHTQCCPSRDLELNTSDSHTPHRRLRRYVPGLLKP